MILADEAFDGATGNFLDLHWMLGDHQGSVTSALSHNSGQTSVVQQLARRGSIATLKDANKDSRAMVSREQKAYAFGSIGSIKDGQGNNVTTGPISRFAYTGREFDPETGDYYYRARYYDPQTGRFLSQDPIGLAAGDMNLHRYVGNSSPNWVDPSGLRADERMTSGPSSPTGHAGPVRYNDGSGPQPMMPPGPVAPPGRSGPILDGESPMGMLPGYAPPGGDLSHLYMTTNAIMPTGGLPPSDPTIVTLPTGGQIPGPTTITLPGGTVVPLYPEPIPIFPTNTPGSGKSEPAESHVCTGYLDIGITIVFGPPTLGFGPVIGVFVTSDGIYPYAGVAGGTAGVSGNAYLSNQSVSPGKLAIQIAYAWTPGGVGGAWGRDQDGNEFCETGGAAGSSGVSASAYYTSKWTLLEWIVHPIYWFVRQ